MSRKKWDIYEKYQEFPDIYLRDFTWYLYLSLPHFQKEEKKYVTLILKSQTFGLRALGCVNWPIKSNHGQKLDVQIILASISRQKLFKCELMAV